MCYEKSQTQTKKLEDFITERKFSDVAVHGACSILLRSVSPGAVLPSEDTHVAEGPHGAECISAAPWPGQPQPGARGEAQGWLKA